MKSIHQQYDEQGYAIVRHVLDADLIGEASRHVEWLRGNKPRPKYIPGKHLPFRGCEPWR